MLNIKNNRVLSSAEHSQHIETTFDDKKGVEHKWTWLKRTEDVNAVIVVPTIEDKIILIKEFRVPVKKTLWQFPAGIIEKDELPEVAAARELKEETGLNIKKILKKATPPLYSSAGITNEGVCFIYVEAEGELSTRGNEDTEEIKPLLLDRKEVRAILDDLENNPMESKAYLILDRFADTGMTTGNK